jgi:hypothetical protein
MKSSIIIALAALFVSFAIVGCGLENPMTPDELKDDEASMSGVFVPTNVKDTREGHWTNEQVSRYVSEKVVVEFINNSGKAKLFEIERILPDGSTTTLVRKVASMPVGGVVAYTDSLANYPFSTIAHKVRVLQDSENMSAWSKPGNTVTLK